MTETLESIYGGPHSCETIINVCVLCFVWPLCRYDSEDCSTVEEVPDFAPLSDYHLVPELQLKSVCLFFSLVLQNTFTLGLASDVCVRMFNCMTYSIKHLSM